jgi:hypothetical protein
MIALAGNSEMTLEKLLQANDEGKESRNSS